jgi:hypothetical protein
LIQFVEQIFKFLGKSQHLSSLEGTSPPPLGSKHPRAVCLSLSKIKIV